MSKDLKESVYDSSKKTELGIPLYIHERLCKQARDTAVAYAGKPKNQLNMVGQSIWFYDENHEPPRETRINNINDLTQKEADEFIKNVNKYFEKLLSRKTKEEIPPYIINNLSEVAKKRTFDSKDKPVYRSVLTNDTTSLFLWDSTGHSNAAYYYHQLSLEKADEFIEEVNSYFENLDGKKEVVQEEKNQEEEDKKLSLTEKTNGVPNYLWFKLSDEAKKHFKLSSEKLKSGRWQTTVTENLISVEDCNGFQIKFYSLVNVSNGYLDIAAKEINNYYKLVSQLENKFSAEFYRALDENKATLTSKYASRGDGETQIEFKMNDFSCTIGSNAKEPGVEDFIESVHYITKKLYEPEQFNAYSDFGLKTTTKVSLADMEQSVSLWDYYHDKPVFQSKHGIAQGDREFPIKPFIRFGKKAYFVDASEKTKHEWYSKITQKVKINTASGEVTVPAFIKEIIGNKKVYIYADSKTTHGALKAEQDTFFILSIASDYRFHLIEVSPKVYEKYYEKMCKVHGETYIKTIGLVENFWNRKEYFLDETEPKITHLALVVDDRKKEISYEHIKINGEEKSLQEAFQIKSDFIKKTINKIEKVYEKIETKQVPKQEEKQEEEKNLGQIVKTVATTNANVNKLKEIIVSDSVEVYKRISVSRISKLVQDILIQIISAAAPKNKKQVHSQLESFFKSEKGKALVQLVSGASLPFVLNHIPEKYREYISVASDELRIQGEAQIALEIIDSFSGFMKTKIIEDLISSGEFVRVDVSSRKKENNLDSEEIESQQSSSILLQGAL
jgi:hypothetical protein